ncbi:MAG: sulfatase-like hydrolase/transferase [Aeoliella sp.]
MTWSNFVLAVVLAVSSTTCVATERPNILLIVSEDNGPELGCYGDPYVKTPVLNKLADEGVRFENAFVPQAGCSQSRAALLTGLYPHQNGQIGLATWKFRLYREDTPNIVRSLKQVGYRTGIIGKLHINPASAFPFDTHKIPSSNFGRKKLADYAKHAEEFITASDEPFFLSVNYPDAHRPFTKQVDGLPAKPLTGDDVKPLDYFGLDTPELREQTANYYNCMSRLDSQIGDLLKSLEKSGKADDTLVVYLGDHGADMLRGKRTSYEGGVRVPLIVRWPGRIKAKQVRDELVSTLDLMPTFLAAAGAELIANLPGRPMLSLLGNEQTTWREYLFTEFHLHSAHNFYPQRTVRNSRYKLIQNLMPGETNPGYSFTLKRFFTDLPKAIDSAPAHIRDAYRRMETPPKYELYDLNADPSEFRNLASEAEHSETLSELKQQLGRWRSQTKDPLLNPDNLQRLKGEIDACFVNGKASKSQLKLNYPDYFFKAAAASTPASRSAVIIHRQGDHDCHTFRIPGIARTNKGALLGVYDLRYNSGRDLQGHMDIGLSRSTDGGRTWSPPRPIMDMGEFGALGQDQNGCSDPNILVDRVTGEIFVSAVWTHGKPGTHQWVGKGSEPGLDVKHSSQFMVVRSTDDGVTWSKPENWTARLKNPKWYLFAPAPGNGITLSDGTLVMPTQGRDATGRPFSNLMWSRNRGKSWTVSNPARTDTTECAVAELSDGSLMLNMRDNRNRRDKSDTNGRAVSVTADRGQTWKVHSSDHGALPEPVCMASLISHVLPDDRRVLFFSNPNSKTHRRNMAVRMSLDDGNSWPPDKQILLDHRGGAYSSLVMVDDDTLGILYESSRADLVFQTIELSEFGL